MHSTFYFCCAKIPQNYDEGPSSIKLYNAGLYGLLLQCMHTSAMNLLSLKKKDIILEIYLEITHWQLKNQLLIVILSRKRNIKIKTDPIVMAHILSPYY